MTDEERRSLNLVLTECLGLRLRLDALVDLLAQAEPGFREELDLRTDQGRKDFRKTVEGARLLKLLEDFQGRKQ